MSSLKPRYIGPPHAERFKPGEELDREHDTTQLRFKTFQHQPHKDYLGHVFRWGFVSRHVNRQSRILDAGCGQDFPLLLSLGGANPTTVPELYVGVDLNPLPAPPKRKWANVHGDFDLIKRWEDLAFLYGSFNLIVSLEVLEHVAPDLSLLYLKALRELASPDAQLILSTPVYSHRFKMARNHINERTKAEVEDDLNRTGWRIVGQHGTFGNFGDYAKVMTPEERSGYDRLREFYGDEVLGCYLAPRYPEASRNVTHVAVRSDSDGPEACDLKPSVIR